MMVLNGLVVQPMYVCPFRDPPTNRGACMGLYIDDEYKIILL